MEKLNLTKEEINLVLAYRNDQKEKERNTKIFNILEIATNYSNKGNFASYTWKEDMISEAVMTCLKYKHNFKPEKFEKPNPFAYFTTVIHNAFINYIRKQNKHSEIKDICYKKAHILDEDKFHFTAKAIDYRDLRKYDKPAKRKKKS